MSREELIDYIDSNYNTAVNYEKLDKAMAKVLGINDVDHIDDSDPNEGMYHEFSTSQLEEIKNLLDGNFSEKTRTVMFKLTARQIASLHKMLNDFSEVAFSKDSELAADAAFILNQLNNTRANAYESFWPTPDNARPNQCKLEDLAEQGIISWETLAHTAMSWMSDSDVGQMGYENEFFIDDDEEEYDEEEDDEEE